MKKSMLFLFIFLPFVCGITAGHKIQKDTIPKEIKVEAMKRTNNQIDSVYSNTKVPPYIDALRDDFRVLRSHIDTINAMSIMREKANELAAIERDKAVQDLLISIHQNTKLRKENKEQERKIDFAKSAPHYFMIFITVLASSYFGSGIGNYLNKRKKND